jgi:acyl-CoA synthetase (AMP-forming)/AMP-acid ligase II
VVGVAVQVRAGADLSLEALRAWCRERMRVEATPVRWFRLNEIPKSGRGKVNRDAVRRACLELLS